MIEEFLNKVRIEVAAARTKFPGQEGILAYGAWVNIITEEIGEVARVLNDVIAEGRHLDSHDELRIREELVQVAAMCARMDAATLGSAH